MITSITKNSHKCSLLGLAVILLISGCGLTNAKPDNNSNQTNIVSTQTDRTENKQDVIELSFQQQEIFEPQPSTPGEDWAVAKEQILEETVIILYRHGSGSAFYTAYAKHAGNYYLLSSNYNAETVGIQPLKGEFGGIKLIGGVGSDQTIWDVLGVNKEGQLVMFSAIGRPGLADIDNDGTLELVASFLGAHLNFPDVEIVRVNNGRLESARVIDAPGGVEDPQYARTFYDSGSYFIQIGKVREEGSGREYRYHAGRLVERDPDDLTKREQEAIGFAEEYLSSIQNGNTERLQVLFEQMYEHATLKKVEEFLAVYKQELDLSSTTVDYRGHGGLNVDGYMFELHDQAGAAHEILIYRPDGMMAVVDNFAEALMK